MRTTYREIWDQLRVLIFIGMFLRLLKLTRRFGGHAWDQMNSLMLRATIKALRVNDWHIVKFDPTTEPGERPIVVDELS